MNFENFPLKSFIKSILWEWSSKIINEYKVYKAKRTEIIKRPLNAFVDVFDLKLLLRI